MQVTSRMSTTSKVGVNAGQPDAAQERRNLPESVRHKPVQLCALTRQDDQQHCEAWVEDTGLDAAQARPLGKTGVCRALAWVSTRVP